MKRNVLRTILAIFFLSVFACKKKQEVPAPKIEPQKTADPEKKAMSFAPVADVRVEAGKKFTLLLAIINEPPGFDCSRDLVATSDNKKAIPNENLLISLRSGNCLLDLMPTTRTNETSTIQIKHRNSPNDAKENLKFKYMHLVPIQESQKLSPPTPQQLQQVQVPQMPTPQTNDVNAAPKMKQLEPINPPPKNIPQGTFPYPKNPQAPPFFPKGTTPVNVPKNPQPPSFFPKSIKPNMPANPQAPPFFPK